MHRDILIACLPCFVVLCVAMLALRGLLAVGAASWDWRRLTETHRCQRGGVQSLAFVLTMPVFIMVVMLIVQVSQLMIAQMVLHYAAFAGARSASVWLPAAVDDPAAELDDYAEVENRVSDRPTTTDDDYTTFTVAATSSQKLWKVRAAVVQALAPLAPSRDLGVQANSTQSANLANTPPLGGHLDALILAHQQMYSTLVPSSQSNSRIPVRIAKKLSYVDQRTRVVVEWRDGRNASGRDSLNNTSYNVRNHPCPNPEMQTSFRESEIGWQDPITVYVIHEFALLPGPGRFLAARLVGSNGLPDRVSPRIKLNNSGNQKVYTTQMTAAATIMCEGLKSVKPLVQPTYALPGR